MYYLGLDIGTSGCKAGVFDINGECIHVAHRSYSVMQPVYGAMELDVAHVWNSCLSCLEECGQKFGDKIAAISVASQGEAIFPVTASGDALAHAMTTFDTRSTRQAAYLQEQLAALPAEVLLRPADNMYSASKILWQKENGSRNDDFEKQLWKYMCFSDYAVWMLCGVAAIDYSMASRTLLFDVKNKCWHPDALKICGIDKELLSDPVPSGTALAAIRPALAQKLGLSADTMIVSGGHDQQCCAFGVGAVADGVVMDTLGTTESLLAVSPACAYDARLLQTGIPCDAFLFTGSYAYLGFLSTSGQVTDWYKRTLLKDQLTFAQLSETGSAPTGLLAIPHFAGSGTPVLDAKNRGLIYGLTAATDTQTMFKGLLEGTAYEVRLNIDKLREYDFQINQIRVTGGGASSDLWVQVKADITGIPQTVMKAKESGCLGAAMLAAKGAGHIAAGEYPWVKIDHVTDPDPENQKRYEILYQQYKLLHQKIGEIRHELYLP